MYNFTIQNLDNWNFPIFRVEILTENQPLRYITQELFKKYNLLSTFKVCCILLLLWCIFLGNLYKVSLF